MRKGLYLLGFMCGIALMGNALWGELPARPKVTGAPGETARGILRPPAMKAATGSGLSKANPETKKPPAVPASAVNLSYTEAQSILAAINGGLPAELRDKSPADLETFWPEWVTQHDEQTRARLLRGDEDTMVNFLVLGMSFTHQPRFTAEGFARAASALAPAQLEPDQTPESILLFKRVDDLLRGLAVPGNNERLIFLSHLVEQQGYHPHVAFGVHASLTERNRLKGYLLENVGRVFREQERLQLLYDQARQKKDHPENMEEVSTLYHARGVSLDTVLWPNMALEESLKAMAAGGLMTPGSIHHVAIIGPGLDFTDKLGGYDFYPQQTLQCFAVADSLLRLGLANQGELQITTFDISQRVNDHLQRALRRARLGQGYVVQLPRDAQAEWSPAATRYWRQFGDQVGTPVPPIHPPTLAGVVETRAIRINPAVVSAITPLDLDIVTQHLDTPPGQGFDLIIATNVFAYFDSFEQLLAVANSQPMLRPGGFLFSNNVLPLLPSLGMRLVNHLSISYSDRPNDGDVISWYQRPPQ